MPVCRKPTGTCAPEEYDNNINAGDQVITGAGSSLDCLNRILQACNSDNRVNVNRCAGVRGVCEQSGTDSAFSDDCVLGSIMGGTGEAFTWEEQNRVSPLSWGRDVLGGGAQGARDRFSAFTETDARYEGPGGTNGTLVGLTFSAFLDDQCRPARNVPPESVCDQNSVNLRSLVSPLSLIWNKEAIEREVAVPTQFPLNPHETGRWYRWLGSAEQPLVVFDPEHTGVITTAMQLVGQYLNSNSWENGYYALRSFDRNGDGAVSGDELQPLGLWFDYNRNAVSDPGEVLPITSSGVTSLATAYNSEDAMKGELRSSHGYTATVDGKNVIGESVDWFSPSFLSKEAAMVGIPKQTENSPLTSKDTPGARFSGVWRWTLTMARSDLAPKGLITLRVRNGQIRGFSIVESPIKRNKAGISSYVTVVPTTGEFKQTDSSGRHIASIRAQGEDGLWTETELVLDASAQTLFGRSSAQVRPKGQTSPITTVTYDWTADRV